MGKEIKIGRVSMSNKRGLVLIAGPCVIESESMSLRIAERLKKISIDTGVPLIFKASYDKANRTSIKSFRGPGLEKGLKVLQKVRKEFDVPVITDVHEQGEVKSVAEVVDIIQVPAFLCRQTDLLVAAAKTLKPVNVKKGQFMAPGDMKYVIEKVRHVGNDKIMITERGTFFGYGSLVVDMRSFPQLASFGCPVIFDVTHSLQEPGAEKGVTGGQPEYITYLANAAAACGIAGLFVEVHPDPSKSLSDGASMLKLRSLKDILLKVKEIDRIIKNG